MRTGAGCWPRIPRRSRHASLAVRWEKPAPVGRARGIALSVGFGSLCALVVEMAYDRAGTPKIVGINAAVDCGIAVNPDQVVGQLEGGILHGLQAARWGRVSFDHGICQISNFGDYRMGRMGDTPPIKVTIVNQKSPLGGIGEVGVPPVAPALANAYAALTGIRKRSLPLGI
jgi:isoquinoline 1-oxidoreductase beta subunit